MDLDIGEVAPGRLVNWQLMQVWAKGSGLTAYYSTDGGVTFTEIGTLTLSADYPTDDDPDYLYFDVVSSKIRFRFRNNTTGETFTLKQFALEAVPREVR
jgi:hypothetical protein